jgi:hypothetical protein
MVALKQTRAFLENKVYIFLYYSQILFMREREKLSAYPF